MRRCMRANSRPLQPREFRYRGQTDVAHDIGAVMPRDYYIIYWLKVAGAGAAACREIIDIPRYQYLLLRVMRYVAS